MYWFEGVSPGPHPQACRSVSKQAIGILHRLQLGVSIAKARRDTRVRHAALVVWHYLTGMEALLACC